MDRIEKIKPKLDDVIKQHNFFLKVNAYNMLQYFSLFFLTVYMNELGVIASNSTRSYMYHSLECSNQKCIVHVHDCTET